jgi:hypothetical protein
MQWRTSDDQTRQQSRADCHLDAFRARVESLAANARHPLEITHHGGLCLGQRLLADLQVARRTRSGFGDADGTVSR